MFGDLRTNTRGWDIKTFDELSYLITDGEHAIPKRATEGIYLLFARNILNHSLQLTDVDYVDQEEYDRIAKRVVPQEGDVLISCFGTVGRCCSVPANTKFQMVRSVALIRFKEEVKPAFAEYMITSDYLQGQINSSKTTSSQANLFQGKNKGFKRICPTNRSPKPICRFCPSRRQIIVLCYQKHSIGVSVPFSISFTFPYLACKRNVLRNETERFIMNLIAKRKG